MSLNAQNVNVLSVVLKTSNKSYFKNRNSKCFTVSTAKPAKCAGFFYIPENFKQFNKSKLFQKKSAQNFISKKQNLTTLNLPL